MNIKALKRTTLSLANRKEKFRFGERKKGRAKDITLSADLVKSYIYYI